LVKGFEPFVKSFTNGGKCQPYTTIVVIFGLWKIFGNGKILIGFLLVQNSSEIKKISVAQNSSHADNLWVLLQGLAACRTPEYTP
jgi:hypothetical protein